MRRIIRVAAIISVFFYPLFGSIPRDPIVEASGFCVFASICFFMFMILSIFVGGATALVYRERSLERPSLCAPFFKERSALQFFWFCGLLSCSGGLGAVIGNASAGVSSDGILLISGGLGFLVGCWAVVRIFSGRFKESDGYTDCQK